VDETILTEDGTVSYDLERWQRALRPLQQAITQGRITLSSDENDSLAKFDGGGLRYMRNWPVKYRQLQQSGRADPNAPRIHVGPLPIGILGGQSLALVARSRHAEQAIQLIHFLTDVPAQKILAAHGFAPTRISAYSDSNLNLLIPHLQSIREAVEKARPRPIHPDYGQFSKAVHKHAYALLHQNKELPAEFVTAMKAALS
jgi:multiple sugar transport system substrate-binding protein